MRRLIIWPDISRRLGATGLTHEALLRLLNGMRSDLETHYAIYSVLRDEDEPRYFRYLVSVVDGPTLHEFDFVVDDSTSPDHVFIDDFSHTAEQPRMS
jgi:hypothetical protein